MNFKIKCSHNRLWICPKQTTKGYQNTTKQRQVVCWEVFGHFFWSGCSLRMFGFSNGLFCSFLPKKARVIWAASFGSVGLCRSCFKLLGGFSISKGLVWGKRKTWTTGGSMWGSKLNDPPALPVGQFSMKLLRRSSKGTGWDEWPWLEMSFSLAPPLQVPGDFFLKRALAQAKTNYPPQKTPKPTEKPHVLVPVV